MYICWIISHIALTVSAECVASVANLSYQTQLGFFTVLVQCQ